MSDETLYFLVGLVLGPLIYYVLVRWAFGIKRQLWNQKAIVSLLVRICEKLDASDDEVEVIKKRNRADNPQPLHYETKK